jgi:hypothetical protein
LPAHVMHLPEFHERFNKRIYLLIANVVRATIPGTYCRNYSQIYM